MLDERQFLLSLSGADSDKLAQVLAHPTAEQESALRLHLGDARFDRMHESALRQTWTSRRVERQKGNVVVIHGIMGAELSFFDPPRAADLLWVNYFRLAAGWIGRLALGQDGLAGPDIRASGIMLDYYGELVLNLREQGWNVRAFWYDWRTDLNSASDHLSACIDGWFGPESPVHIVAHSLGGLVAGAFIRNHRVRWESMRPSDGSFAAGGRLVLLGTPTYGSFAIPQISFGLEPTIRRLALLDLTRGLNGIREVVNTFPGLFQMLPSPAILPDARKLYDSRTYTGRPVLQYLLDRASEFHGSDPEVYPAERTIYIAGYGFKTWSRIVDWGRLDQPRGYQATLLGDGRVTHELGIPRAANGTPLESTYFVEIEHGELSRAPRVLSVMDAVLTAGRPPGLSQEVPGGVRGAADGTRLAEELARESDRQVEEFDALITHSLRSRAEAPPGAVTPEERLVREHLLGNPPPPRGEDRPGPDGPGAASAGVSIMSTTGPARAPVKPVEIEIRLAWDGIDTIDDEKDPRIDAISVGHYFGPGRLQDAELALDRAMTAALEGTDQPLAAGTRGILEQYTERRILQGELGQPFLLPDPRRQGRVIAVAGMGVPGRFGSPELIVLARELFWALGRLSLRHLATVLIGAGAGNLKIGAAVDAWIQGIRYALTGSRETERHRVLCVTFVENAAGKLKSIDRGIREAKAAEDARSASGARLAIRYTSPDWSNLHDRSGRSFDELMAAEDKAAGRDRETADAEPVPARITLSLEGKRYRFGAITAVASIPEREITLNQTLVRRSNDRLTSQRSLDLQYEWGRYLAQLLIPEELRAAFDSAAPVVMMLDAAAARIHWELIALKDVSGTELSAQVASTAQESFLGTSRGFTRQLRTMFAPLPEPPPPPQRVLSVLIVADPAEDARLAGAEQEGREIFDLFAAFNEVYRETGNSIEVKYLAGPREATIEQVHFLLTRKRYDLLHYAGHCLYDTEDPAASGWVFSGGERLTASELTRVDRIPKFVFSNACESGVTPSRAEMRNPMLAPAFAEAFFARGVAEFVCTAWPVGDRSARQFALTLYGSLLGLDRPDEGSGYQACPPLQMSEAMRRARTRLLASRDSDAIRTWGAYQHYGSPYFRLFDNLGLGHAAGPQPGAAPAESAAR